ncbi:MAG TPA: rhombosortase [Steroidobacteraceae bacterium]|nr:rhombosortase [Steroidobacteraceae bacterium]
MTAASLAKFRAGWHARRATAFAIVAAVLLLAHALGPAVGKALRYERGAVAAGEWWRLLGCHLVHYDATHLAMNVGGLALLWWLYGADARGRDWLFIALASALGVSLGLWFLEPTLSWYLGLSGVLHGIWAGAGIMCWKRWPLESVVTLALLAAKLMLESVHGPLSGALGASLPVITAAHRYGALAGLVAAVALRSSGRSV